MRAIIIATNHDRLNNGKATGAYLSEISHPWDLFRAMGLEVTIASMLGGRIPLDGLDVTDETNNRILAAGVLDDSKVLTRELPADYELAFFAGGHGAMWDFTSPEIAAWAQEFLGFRCNVLGAVCHGVAVCLGLSAFRDVSCFTDAEENLAGTITEVPCSLETTLAEKGYTIRKAKPWCPCVTVSGRLVTGQNPASARGVAFGMLKLLF